MTETHTLCHAALGDTAAAEPLLPSSVLMLGIGGMGMAPLAIYLSQAGVRVLGCDDHFQPRVRALLEGAGVVLLSAAEVDAGFAVGRFTGVGLCAVSSAIGPTHPLLALARAHGLRVLRRGELLAQVARSRRLIAIVGSHGKTTTTGFIIEILTRFGLEFDYVLGGLFQDKTRLPARHVAASQWLVAEVDESDGTIEHFSPELTVAVNFDWDHTDRYASAEALRQTFRSLFERTTAGVVFPEDDQVLRALVSPQKARPCRIGAEAKVKGFNGYNQTLARATAAIVLPHRAQQAAAFVFDGLGGIFRRQEWLYTSPCLRIITDYAHHPREVASLLAYLRSLYPADRLVAVFQPHRYTRTRQFAAEFAQVLEAGADAFFLLPVYAASEVAFAEGRTEMIAAAASAATAASARAASAAVAATGAGNAAAAAAASAPVRVYEPCEISAQCRAWLNATATEAKQVQEEDDSPEQADCENALAAGSSVGSSAGGSTTLVFIGAGDIDALARRTAADCLLRDRWAAALNPRTVLRLGEPLARRTTMRLGGSARFYAEPATREDIATLVQLAKAEGLRLWPLGRGSNLIVPDAGFDGLVIGFNGDAFRVIEPLPDGRWYVGSGVALKRLCAQAAREGLSGWEFLDGIPGTVGGALRMNAGAMGKWMFDVVESVDVLEAGGTIARRGKDDFTIEYRRCHEIADGAIALGAVLRPDVQIGADEVRRQLDTYACRRKETQPREPSAGCIFKNPEGHHAGALIDELGLKGLRVGGAEVSPVHGNFIINRGGATAADVLELVRQVRARVLAGRGIELEPEALLLGVDWKDVL